MTKHSFSSQEISLTPLFNDAASSVLETPAEDKTEKSSRITVRFTDDEREKLQMLAGSMAISGYIRNRLFGDEEEIRAKRYRKKRREPTVDVTLLGQLLGKLGQSEMTKALFALLLAAESGKAELPDSSLQNLDRACGQIEEMRDMLIIALGVKPQGQRRR